MIRMTSTVMEVLHEVGRESEIGRSLIALLNDAQKAEHKMATQTISETDLEHIESLFSEVCSINQQIGILADAIAIGNLDEEAVESISILAKHAGMFADMGMQKFGPGAIGGPESWLYPPRLRVSE